MMAYKLLSLLLVIDFIVNAQRTSNRQDLQPSCDRKIYCGSEILHYVQMNQLYNDSKTFVDMRLLTSEDEIHKEFSILLEKTNKNPTEQQLRDFVERYMAPGEELETWTPLDFTLDPEFLERIQDADLKKFARDLNAIWPTLGRRVRSEVSQSPDRYSLVDMPNGFVVPGGRFKEIYYWDSYWVIKGLLLCDMKNTSRGMIENLLSLVKKKNHVPNGSRVYYDQRSQPPLLTAMAQMYVEATGDLDWLKLNIETLEKELQYWLVGHTVNVGRYKLLRYNAPSTGPRPESYSEDYTLAHSGLFQSEGERQQLYTDLKSAAESGWDFSSRWFAEAKRGNLSSIRTTKIVPVDLNAIFAGALRIMGEFQTKLGNARSATKYRLLAGRWIYAIERVLWDVNDGIWYDYDLESSTRRKNFYPSNVAPLWADAVYPLLARDKGRRLHKYLLKSGSIAFPGGVPTSLFHTNEQWDFPNGWPPLESFVVGALDRSGYGPAKKLATSLAGTWVRSNFKAFNETGKMYEKYDVRGIGSIGGGGEYTVQDGFGWTNGVIFEFLDKYGSTLKFVDSNKTNKEVEEYYGSNKELTGLETEDEYDSFEMLSVLPLKPLKTSVVH